MYELKLFTKAEAKLENLIKSVTIFSSDFTRIGGMWLPSNERMKAIQSDSGYKYLEVLEADGIRHRDIKEKTTKEYL